MEHQGFPSDETLAAFIDGRLDGGARKRVIAHIATCDECYSVVVAASERDELFAAGVRHPKRRPFLFAATLAAAALIAYLTPLVLQRVNDPLAELAKEVKHRHTEARIAGFPYLPYEPPLRDAASNDFAGDSKNWKAMGSAAEIAGRATKHPTPRNIDALAISYLIVGNHDDAAQSIERALRVETGEPTAARALMRSKDARILSDAAAIYLSRAQASANPGDYSSAVEAARRAWSLAQQPEIAWNRALAIESLHIPADALAAWNDYLKLDATSPWAAEARQHIAKLRRPTDAEEWQRIQPILDVVGDPSLDSVVTRYSQQSRIYVEETLLPDWGSATLAGNRERAASKLATARALAASLSRVAPSIDAGAVRAIDASTGSVRLGLARGHVAYGLGRKHFDGQSFDDAQESFHIAVRELGSSPFAPVARLEEIACRLMHDDYAEVLRAVAELESRSTGADLPLRGKMSWIRGLAELQLGHPDKAIELYQNARMHFSSAREDDNRAAIDGNLADALETVGDRDAAMRFRLGALATIERIGGTTRHHTMVMAEAAYAAMKWNQNAAAQLFLSPLIEDRASTGGSTWRCTALVWSSSLRAETGDREGAMQDLARAQSACHAIADETARQRLVANIQLADTVLPADPVEALRWLDTALAFFRRSGNRRCIAALLDRRGRAFGASGDARRAEADFREGIATIELTRDAIAGEEQRETFVANVSRIYDDLLNLLIAEQRYVEAFEVAERSRAADVDHSHHGTGRSSRPHSDWLREQLPDDVAIVEYALRGRTLVTWLITRKQISAFRRSDVDVAALAAQVERVSNAPRQADLLRLGDLLVEPWLQNLAPESTIVFVPDAAIEGVPFSALIDRNSGRHVAEQYATGVAPSALSFVASAMSYGERRDGTRTLLVADPALDHVRYPSLPRLTAAHETAETLGKLYPDAVSIIGEAATRASFISQARSANVIDFAGHALVNESAPRFSALLLSSGAEDDGRLYVRELPKGTFGRARLAVLSACSTARGSQERRGTATLARAFMNSGVPAVVGTLWPVPDDVAASFSRSFHHSIRNGRPPAAALRAAQMAMLHSPDARIHDASSWGAFRLLGAATTLKEGQECLRCGSSTQVSAR